MTKEKMQNGICPNKEEEQVYEQSLKWENFPPQ